MGPVWGDLILKNLKQNPAFWVSCIWAKNKTSNFH
jgi:hypothetical protein